MSGSHLPYFDFLLSQIAERNQALETSFGRHVHWGYWADPSAATCSDDDYARAAENLTIELIRLAHLENGQKILDAGCGFGGTIAYLNEEYSNMHLAGLNIDDRQLLRARQMIEPLNGNQVQFVQGDACELPFEDNTFDRVLAVECVFHFPSRVRFFEEVNRVLRPGGCLTLSDFVPSPLYLPASWASSVILNRFNIFGTCHVQYTLGRYKSLARHQQFSAGGVNITKNTLPTYTYLKQLIRGTRIDRMSRSLSNMTVNLLHFLGASRLLNYRLLHFEKRQDFRP